MSRLSFALRLVAICTVLALWAIPAVADHHEEKAPADHGELKFAPMAEGNPVEMALLWGDPAVGPFAAVLKFPAGHENPMHTHSSSYTAVMIQGSVLQWNDGESTEGMTPFVAGDSTKQAAGNYHAENFGADGPALVFLYMDGPIDFVPKEAE